MNGVEILSSEIIYNTYIPEWWTAIACAILIICAFVGGLICSSTDYPIFGVICIVLGGCVYG